MLDKTATTAQDAPCAANMLAGGNEKLIATDWYAVRRSHQIRMTHQDRAEFLLWTRRVVVVYVCIAVIGLAWTAAHSHSATIKQFAGEIRTALIGHPPARGR
jgi:cbb3-type cytochrome oxidase subunit 1